MTVRELIAKLAECDQEAVVITDNRNWISEIEDVTQGEWRDEFRREGSPPERVRKAVMLS